MQTCSLMTRVALPRVRGDGQRPLLITQRNLISSQGCRQTVPGEHPVLMDCCCSRLLQAAYSLPRWLKPETASNRVWLHCGQVHIVPPPSDKAPSLPAAPSALEALAVLRSGVFETRRKK
jgi:hypothetical protein